jgi:hypothetical protein
MPLITIEPRSGGDVLQNVATGKCDAELGVIAALLRAYGGPAVIRWGHEAENRIYPWVEKLPKNTSRLTGTLLITSGAI